ncbi:MAG: GNAT family N-acetyltransferase [Thermoplasmatota archaeon]
MNLGHASLEPLRPEHAKELLDAAQDPAIWRFMPNPMPESVEAMEAWIQMRIGGSPDDPCHVAGTDQYAFLVRDADGTAAGSTSLYALDRNQKRAEIGWTWYGTRWHGTLLNKACKRLMLAWAFDELGLRRVQMKCDARNTRSFHAMAALGAVHEGTLRRHDMMWDGHIRDAELFSITDLEWPTVRARLDERLR